MCPFTHTVDDGAAHFNDNARENYLKPGFEDLFVAAAAPDGKADSNSPSSSASAGALDSDLDDEIYADQLHSLLQRISPDLDAFLQQQRPSMSTVPSIKSSSPPRGARFAMTGGAVVPLSDEQQVLNLLHGTAVVAGGADDRSTVMPGVLSKKSLLSPARSGIFEGAFQGPKVFRQSVMTQTVRRPDGTVETRRVVRDADGNTSTTVTKTTADGDRSETSSSSNGSSSGNSGGGGNWNGGGCFDAKPPPGGLPANGAAAVAAAKPVPSAAVADRNVYVTKEGYAMPMNIW